MLAGPMKFTMYCFAQWISKLSGSFEIHRVRQYLVNIALIQIKSQYMKRPESNFYVGPVNTFLIFDTAYRKKSRDIFPYKVAG